MNVPKFIIVMTHALNDIKVIDYFCEMQVHFFFNLITECQINEMYLFY